MDSNQAVRETHLEKSVFSTVTSGLVLSMVLQVEHVYRMELGLELHSSAKVCFFNITALKR
jgi:hypothetical protein